MDHIKVLKRAFQITHQYRALWIFGILLALTTAGNRGGSGSSSGGGGGGGGGGFLPSEFLADLRLPAITAQAANNILIVILLLSCLFFVLIVGFTILRYLSETALIRMVDHHEASGEKVSVGAGFRLGWTRSTFRIFLIDLVFGLAGVLGFLLLALIAAAPLLVWLTDNEAVQIVGSIISGSLFLVLIFLLIAVVIALSLLLQFMRRACILEDLGVFEAIRRGYALFRQRLGDALIMGILLFAIGLAFVILLIPLAILLLMVGVILGGLPGLLVGWLVSLVAEGNWPWMVGAMLAVPIFLTVVIAPLVFLSGLFETYKSSAWTLAFREMAALEVLPPGTLELETA